jgi:hypothetical protein
MTELISAQDRRRETARNNARQQAQKTLERLTEGIAALTRAGAPITAKTIEAQAGLSYRTITRNVEAYALFCKHAAYFQPTQPSRAKAATKKPAKPKAAAWDPLLWRPKRELANRARAEHRRVSELEQALVTNAVQLQELARRNLALEAELAQTTRRLGYLVAEHRAGPA